MFKVAAFNADTWLCGSSDGAVALIDCSSLSVAAEHCPEEMSGFPGNFRILLDFYMSVCYLMPLDAQSALVGYRGDDNEAIVYVATMNADKTVAFDPIQDVCFQNELREMHFHGLVIDGWYVIIY
jgi:hypothetical protein